MKKPESRLQARICRALEAKFGGWWRKIWGGPFQRAGIPDLLGCVHGYFFGLEVKMPGEEPSEIQKYELNAITGARGVSGVVTSVKEAVDLVVAALAERGIRPSKAPKRDRSIPRARGRKNPRRPRSRRYVEIKRFIH